MTDYLQQDLNGIANAAQQYPTTQPQADNGYNWFPQSYASTKAMIQKGTAGFTIVGIATFGIILWVGSQNATGSARKIINGFLGVLLLSMLLLNWSKIKPIFFKS